ncbi:ubiquitin carboxyl-terminal hydrolase CYLD isoform X3 [Musca domestica]|uniref:ubiquitinyl hydrolase 1 n=1 Tax=Musca domestica TaxID=7370 RepID=A0ABM3VDZ1_MUSDO|nr:ubiquitin carboxyl-terminal hydrolase CYLD isoform X3 [Musca domestica]
MDGCTISKYAVVNRSSKLRLHYSSDVPPEKGVGANGCSDEFTVPAGTLIKIYQWKGPVSVGSKIYSTVQVLDLISQLPIYENLYECPQANLTKVPENLWPFVISIVDPDERLRMIKNTEHCKWISYLKVNDFVSVKGEVFSNSAQRFDCIVRYIGPVRELQPVGYFFALELLHLDSGPSPQADKIPFCGVYMQCESQLAIFATANWVTPIPKDIQKKFSTREFLSETFEKFKSAIGPSSALTGGGLSRSISPKPDKKPKNKQKEASATFYDTLCDTPSSKPKEMDSKNDNSSVMTADNEEFKQTVENYERSLERRTTNTVQTQTQPQSGILKNKRTDQTKPSSVLNMGDRDIVVIDNTDIDESTRNEESHKKKERGRSCASPQIPYENNITIANQPIYANTPTDDMIATDVYESPVLLPTVLDGNFSESSPLPEIPGTGLGVGSMVEVNMPDESGHLYGVIRWIGVPPGVKSIMVGIELEDDYIDKQLLTTDGGFNGISLFKCPAGRGLFVESHQCSSDRRFTAEEGADGNDVSVINNNNNYKTKQQNVIPDEPQTFGHMDCPIVPGAIAPIKCFGLNDLEELCGKFKGIQGHHNSCYLDVTLFSMFAFTPVFDAVLYRSPDKEDISHYTEVQTVLREEIVNPLRKHMFVRADRVMKLRQLLDKLSSVSGLTSEEKDPEEFLNCLLAQILRAEPFLKLNSGQDAYYYQLFVEKDDRLSFPSVQQLFEQSFFTSDIKLKEVPSCLIIQMPRFGKNYKMYPRILPSQVLDVTDIIEDSPRQCSVCGKLAEFECRDCFGVLQSGVGLESTSFCPKCLETVHMHVKRRKHKHRKLSVPQDFRVMADHIMTVPRLYMELFAVVCIETSHYVAFVKAGSGPDAPWCFFDSMADRKGEQNGYNIPEMITVPDLPQWLSEEGSRIVNETSSNDKMLPEHAKRLFCDAYMCMYQSTDVMMYR